MTAPAQPTTNATAATTAAVASYIGMTAAIRAATLRFLALHWSQLKSWRTPDADRFVAAILPAVTAGQQQTANLTAAYLARAAGVLSGTSPAPTGVPAEQITGEALRGVPPDEVYRRPFETIWTDLSLGKPLDEAVAAGEQRLQVIASTDLQLASTHSAQAAIERMPHVVGYRRVLTGAENCGLCVVASTQRYHRADLMPIHPRCDCAVAPIVGDKDPGQSINSALLTTGAMPTSANTHGVSVYSGDHTIDLGDLLEPVHQAVQAEFGRRATDARAIDYRKVITVHHHGEIGPVLTVTGRLTAKPQTSKR